jgi:hypothetical protein
LAECLLLLDAFREDSDRKERAWNNPPKPMLRAKGLWQAENGGSLLKRCHSPAVLTCQHRRVTSSTMEPFHSHLWAREVVTRYEAR